MKKGLVCRLMIMKILNKIVIVQLVCAQQWGVVGILHVDIQNSWKESNTLLYINCKVNQHSLLIVLQSELKKCCVIGGKW